MKTTTILWIVILTSQVLINLVFIFSILDMKNRIKDLEDNRIRIRIPNIQIGGQ